MRSGGATKFLRTTFFLLLTCTFASLVYGQGSPNVTLLDNVNDYPAIGYNDCWGYTAPDNREYALLGVRNGLSIIDITNAGSATEVAFMPGPFSSWRDIKTYQNYAYVVNETSGGMQIIDLSNLPVSATLVNTYTGFTTSHNIYIETDRGILYAEGGGSQPVRTLDLSDPVNPVQVSSFGIECHDIWAKAGIVYVSEGTQGSIGIFDLTDATTPVLVSRFNLPSPAGYAHNAGGSDDGLFLMTTEETTGKTVKYWDVSDPNNTFITDTYLGPSNLAHNAHIDGNYAFISHYADGLRIVDVTDPNNIFEAGFYDTFPNPGGGFNGAWGAFPFFPSGKILISDIQTGLYVVLFLDRQPPPNMAVTISNLNPPPPTNIPPAGGTITYTGTITNNGGSPTSGDIWSMVTLPNGSQFGPTLQFNNVPFNAGQSRSGNITENVPPNAPPGNYIYNLNFGVFSTNTVIANDQFTFTKSTVKPASVAVAQSSSTFDTDADFVADGDWSKLLAEAGVDAIPEDFVVEQNYPNPFNPSTVIRYGLNKEAHVKVIIFNILGEEIVTLVDEFQNAGYKSVSWNGLKSDGQTVSAGVYIYRIEVDGLAQIKKMVLAK